MSFSNLSSYIIPESPETLSPTDELQDDFDSLPSTDTTSSTEEESDADREWRESLQQLELLLSMIIVPFVGKYFGRKCAYWGWARFMQWKYPVEVKITSPGAFRAAGVVEAAATL